MSEILFSYESSPSFAGPYTAIMGKYQKTTFMNSYSVKTFDEWVLEREDGTVEKIQAFPYKTQQPRQIKGQPPINRTVYVLSSSP